MNIKKFLSLFLIFGLFLTGCSESGNSNYIPASDSSSNSYVQSTDYPVITDYSSSFDKQETTNNLSSSDYYTNVDGNEVHSPAYSNIVPAGASARCGDGTYSFSQHRSGTCSHHSGVAEWL